MAPRWRKVIRDLWGNKARTFLVVLSIAVGVFALGMIMGTNIFLGNDLPTAYAEIDPPHAVIFTQLFDEDLLTIVEEIEGVESVGARRNFRASMQTGEDEWTDIELSFYQDFEDISINKIVPVEGAWPPDTEAVLVERASLPYTNAEIGDEVLIETRNGKQRWVRIDGTTHDLNVPPIQFTSTPNIYANLSMLDWLGEDPRFDELFIRVKSDVPGEEPSAEYVKEVANEVRNKVERGGREVFWIWQPTPGEHPALEAINPLLAILGVLGAFSLFLSGFLVVNIINGLLAQHIRQIGIMKAIGARAPQVFVMYMMTVVVFGLLSLLIAVPLGGLAAYGFAGYLASLINFDLSAFYIPTEVFWVQVVVALGVPLLASLVPVINGARISVREAISDEGVGANQFGGHFIDRAMSFMTTTVLRLSRPMSISLRNTIRRKMRLALTLFTLTLGGAVFISIISVYDSLIATMEDALGYFSYDVDVNFTKAHRITEIERAALQIDGIELAESWIGETTRRLLPNGDETENLFVIGVPHDTNVINPTLTSGRWLSEDDSNAIVLNTAVLQQPGNDEIVLGETLVLKMDGRDTEWVVVGFVRSSMIGPLAYANQDYMAREMNFVGKSGGVQLVAGPEWDGRQAELAALMETHFDAAGLEVSSSSTTDETREQITYQFGIIVSFMAVMAILIAVVGGLGLMGTMSINVMERTREIGVMRAVGASDRSILRIVVVEGLFIGFLSWLLSGSISYPLGQWLSNLVGINLMQSPLVYQFSLIGAVGWIGAILLLAWLASVLPARRASNISVRETLAYE